MIFLDSNVFLRHFTSPSDTLTSQMKESARALFRGAESGTTEVTTSEVVLHEVLYLMTERRHYNIEVETAIDMMEYTIQLRGFRFPVGEQAMFLRALALWRGRPSLGFADSVIAARCEANGWELATFDEQLGALPNVTRWSPEPAA